MAIQDILELDAIFEENLRLGGTSNKADSIKKYLINVKNKLKARPSVEFPSPCDWFNTSESWTGDHLKGRLSLLDFWTYCCINCMHILPDLEELEDEFASNDNVVVIGIHSAKFENERVGANILSAIQRYGIHHPVINDTQATLWNSLSISCWPTVVLCGPDGKPLKFFVGEGHKQDMIDFVKAALEVFHDDLQVEKKSLPKIEKGLSVTDSPLKFPGKVLVSENCVFIADTGNHRILLASTDGEVSTVIGNGSRGHADGNFSEAQFNSPQGLALHGQDDLFVCDTNNHVIRHVDLKSMKVSTIAGNGKQCLNSQMVSGQKALEMALASPWDIVADGNSALMIAMAGSHQIWKYDRQTQIMSLLAGSGKEENRNNSYPLKSSFAQPSGLSFTGEILYVADSESSTIRSFHPKNGVKNVCGGSKNPVDLFSFGDQEGRGTDAKLQHPLGVAYVPDDKLFVADSYNHKLKLVTDLSAKNPNCTACPVTGLNEPGGICFDGKGSLFVADTNNHCIKIINVDSYQVSEFALAMPTSVSDEVDCSKASLVFTANKEYPLRFVIQLDSETSLNQEAPNSWKTRSAKGNIGSDLTINLEPSGDEESLTLEVKLYLCSNQICTVRNKTVSIQLEANASSTDNNFVIDM